MSKKAGRDAYSGPKSRDNFTYLCIDKPRAMAPKPVTFPIETMVLRNFSLENTSMAPQSPVMDYGPKSPLLDSPFSVDKLLSGLSSCLRVVGFVEISGDIKQRNWVDSKEKQKKPFPSPWKQEVSHELIIAKWIFLKEVMKSYQRITLSFFL